VRTRIRDEKITEKKMTDGKFELGFVDGIGQGL
jgi:hypothetical protein